MQEKKEERKLKNIKKKIIKSKACTWVIIVKVIKIQNLHFNQFQLRPLEKTKCV